MEWYWIALIVLASLFLGGAFVVAVFVAAANEWWKGLLNK